jgi:hypothetical protein
VREFLQIQSQLHVRHALLQHRHVFLQESQDQCRVLSALKRELAIKKEKGKF